MKKILFILLTVSSGIMLSSESFFIDIPGNEYGGMQEVTNSMLTKMRAQ